jgi:hypothetical protein
MFHIYSNKSLCKKQPYVTRKKLQVKPACYAFAKLPRPGFAFMPRCLDASLPRCLLKGKKLKSREQPVKKSFSHAVNRNNRRYICIVYAQSLYKYIMKKILILNQLAVLYRFAIGSFLLPVLIVTTCFVQGNKTVVKKAGSTTDVTRIFQTKTMVPPFTDAPMPKDKK